MEQTMRQEEYKAVVVSPRPKWWQFWKFGSKPKNTAIVFDGSFPSEITKAHSLKQLRELTAVSIHYMHTAIPSWVAIGGLANPPKACVLFRSTVATRDAQRAVKEVQFHWKNFIKTMQMHCDVESFCAKYLKGLSPADKAGWDRLTTVEYASTTEQYVAIATKTLR
jgi:hypothetical protein